MARTAESFSEKGATGLVTWGGIVAADEALDRLSTWSVREYLRMAEGDDVVGAGLAAMRADFLAPTWSVDAASSDAKDKEAADFLTSCMGDMSHPWTGFLEELFPFLYLRFALFEVVYKQRRGPDESNPKYASKYADNKIGWRKFAPRAQETICRWDFDDEGGLHGAYQSAAPTYREVHLPIERLLHFHTPRRIGNPMGLSVLRNCHRSWSFRRRMEVVEGIGTERNLAGMPMAGVPESWLAPDATPKDAAALAAMKAALTGLRVDEQACLLYPLVYDERGRRKVQIELASAMGRGNVDTDKSINRYDRKIAMSLLTDFLLLGHESVGSFALATIKIEMFSKAMNTILDRVAGVLNDIAVPRLFRANGWKMDEYPKFVHQTAKAVNVLELASALEKLTKAGFTVSDERTQTAVRQSMKLPVPEESPEEGKEEGDGLDEGESAAGDVAAVDEGE